MKVEMYDPTNHKIYAYVNDEYFYKVLQRARNEYLHYRMKKLLEKYDKEDNDRKLIKSYYVVD